MTRAGRKQMLEAKDRRSFAATSWLTEREREALRQLDGESDSAALLRALVYYVERERPDLKEYFRPGTFSA